MSVILPVYNHGALLGRAIESVLAQTCKDWELVIANDGSTDNSREVAEGFSSRFPRIRLISLRHGGLSAAINAAFGITTGSYLTTLDADDYYSNVHLEDNVRYLKKHPEADLIMSKAKVLGDPYVVDLERPGKMIHLDRCVIGGTVFVKREIFRAVGGMAQIPYGMDYDFARRAEGAGYRIEKRNARTYVYDRTRSGSITKTAEMRMRTGELPDRRFSRAAPSSRGSAGRVTGAYGDFAAGGAEAGAAAASGNPRLRMRALVPASRPRKAR